MLQSMVSQKGRQDLASKQQHSRERFADRVNFGRDLCLLCSNKTKKAVKLEENKRPESLSMVVSKVKSSRPL